MSKPIESQAGLEKNINDLLRKVSFDPALRIFMPGLLGLKWVYDPGEETACTDGYSVFVGPYWSTQTPNQRVGIMIHEMAHCLWIHFHRFRGANMEIANAACDYVINRFVRQLALSSPNIEMMTAPPGCELYDSDEYGDMSEEAIYNELAKQKEEEPDKSFDTSPGGFKAPPQDQDQDGPDDECPGESDGSPINGKPEQAAPLITKWETAMEKITQMARLSGETPGALIKLLDRRASVLDWRSVLHRFLLSCAPEDFSEVVYDRRFMSGGLYLEGIDKPVMDSCVCVCDTSGSMNTAWLDQSKSEISDAIRSVGIKRTWVMDNDANLSGGVREYGPREDIDFTACGGGGTDFRPPFDWVRDQCPKQPACLIFFTDGWGPFPKVPPPYPVLWVTFGAAPEAYPFGEVLDLRNIRK